MDENMNVEVLTEASGAEEVTQEFEYEETTSGPSKGFVGLAVAAGAALVGGGVALVVRHKKKKQKKAEEVEIIDVDDEDFEDAEETEQEEESEEKPAKKK